jgi:chromosome segregation ATPase
MYHAVTLPSISLFMQYPHVIYYIQERVSEYEEEQNTLQLKDDELSAAKTELEYTKSKLWSAVERVSELEDELEATRTELQSVKSGLDVGKMEVKGVKGELESVREQNTRLQQLNAVVVNRLGMLLWDR